mmetsp:Transcript_9454/g.16551  ORF Transcript_9454/g.16551 Transcript_9454/m.16551 type:complete len:221 (-) Transcript_9454:315-977(-)
MMTRGSPFSTSWPSETTTLMILPGMGAVAPPEPPAPPAPEILDTWLTRYNRRENALLPEPASASKRKRSPERSSTTGTTLQGLPSTVADTTSPATAESEGTLQDTSTWCISSSDLDSSVSSSATSRTETLKVMDSRDLASNCTALTATRLGVLPSSVMRSRVRFCSTCLPMRNPKGIGKARALFSTAARSDRDMTARAAAFASSDLEGAFASSSCSYLPM